MLHAVIMAGGAGTRFWPESRAARPKQLLRLVSHQTMLRETADRLAGLVPPERIRVATTAALAGQVLDDLPELPVESLVLEPMGRNTAPCIGLAAMLIARQDPEAVMLVLPADQVIQPATEFRAAVEVAAAIVEDEPDWLITFGIKPTYPAESFGYIERGERWTATAAQLGLTGEPVALPVHRVRQFREKPTAERAKAFLAKGNFFWNSGIFVWKVQRIIAALRRWQPAVHEGLSRIAAAAGTATWQETLRREFAALPSLSIDHGVLEQEPGVLVIEVPFRWDDVGSWQAMARQLGPDADGNTIQAKHVGLRTKSTVVRGPEDHLICTLGVSDLIIVHTPDATLVANKRDEESVRQLVDLLRQKGWTEYL